MVLVGAMRGSSSRFAVLAMLGGCNLAFGISIIDGPLADSGTARAPGWSAVAAGVAHTCAIRREDASLWCWGENGAGETGSLASGPEVLSPVQVAGRWTAVAGGLAHTCAIKDDATLWCWGDGQDGELGAGTVPASPPNPVGTDHWSSVVASSSRTCGLKPDASLWCWGANGHGEIGDGTMANRDAPVPVGVGHTWTQIAMGDDHSCAITIDKQLYCWGDNGDGELGDGTAITRTVPTNITASPAWRAVAAGTVHTCAIDDSGQVWCWGANNYGQLGDGTSTFQMSPKPIATPRTDWVAIASSASRTCLRAPDGAVWCWGANEEGELAIDAPAMQRTPVQLTVPAAAWTALALGALHACLIDGDAQLWCAGSDGRGQRGDGLGGSRLAPVHVPGDWTNLAAGGDSTCGVESGHLACWGENDDAQLGDQTLLQHQAPEQISFAAIGAPATIAMGVLHGCALDGTQHLECWGDNGSGEQVRTGGPQLMPAQPPGITGMVEGLALGGSHTCMIGADTYTYCWGTNAHGELGRGTMTPFEPALKAVESGVLTYPFFTQVAAGGAHSCGLTANGMLSCWGSNDTGQLGEGSVGGPPVAYATSSFNSVAKVVAGTGHTCIIDTSGHLRCFGNNAYGQLGDGTTTTTGTLGGAILGATWTTMALGDIHTCGIQTDGSLWCWGDNARGELGDGTRTQHTTPIRVGTAMWTQVATGVLHTCGIQSDHSLWCWGNNLLGEVGDGAAWTTQLALVPAPH